jgi:hypothetical protein
MKKNIIVLISLMMAMNALAVVTWNGTSSTAWTQGAGTEASPYIISSPNHLAYLAQQVNAGTTYAGVYFKQTQDFNLNSKTWTPIGTSTNKFDGIYDGGSRYISNFKNSLFGYINNAEIKNLTIQGSYSGSGYSMFVSNTNGVTRISNCHNKAKSSETIISGTFGCIVGMAEGTSITIENCSNKGTVSVSRGSSGSNASTSLYMGGIIGYSTGTTTLKNCFNSGSLQMSGQINTNHSYSHVNIYIAGLIGCAKGNTVIDQCYNSGTITATGSGGATASSVNSYVLGLAGISLEANSGMTGLVTRSYCTGNLASNGIGHSPGARTYALCGSANHVACYVANCTMTAVVPSGYVGHITYGNGEFESCYYLGNQNIENLGGSNVYTNSSSNTGSAVYKSEAAFKSSYMISLLNALGEYFTMDLEGVNDGYPILKWQAGTRYKLTASCDANRGTVSGGGEYPNGYAVKLTATPKDGCMFVGWSDGNTDNPRTVTVSGNANYTAQFTKSSYTIYVNQDGTSNIE